MHSSKQHAVSSRVWLFAVIFLTAYCLLPTAIHAADVVQTPYQLLAPLPLNSPSGPDVGTTVASQYIEGIIKLVIAVAGGLAVIEIIVAGIQYMTSDAFSGKSSARQRINDAIVGLLLVIASYTILYTINPQLVAFNLRIAGQDMGSALQLNVGNQPPTTPSTTPSPAPAGACGTASCVTVSSYQFPKKGPGAGCAAGSDCYLNKDLADKLDTLASQLGNYHITKDDWTVTEMDPPQDPNHASSCHTDGTCVDAKLNDPTPSADEVSTFLKQINLVVGGSFLYEPAVTVGGKVDIKASCVRANQLQNAIPDLAPHIRVCHTTTGENVHINLNGGSAGTCGTYKDANGATQDNNVQCL